MLKRALVATCMTAAIGLSSTPAFANDVDPYMYLQMMQLMDQNIHLMQAQQKMMMMMHEGKKMSDHDMKMVQDSIAMAKKANDGFASIYQN